MEGPFLVKFLWIKLWNCAKRECRNPGHVALRLFGAGVMDPEQGELPLRSELHWVNAISNMISNPICYDMTFDIVYDINIRYRMVFIRYRRHETSISTTLFMTFDIEG
jgi:hypothetical protein